MAEKQVGMAFKGKTVLITGGTGSIGSEIARAMRGQGAKAVRVLSNDENGVFNLAQELRDVEYRYFVGDIRDKERVVMACEAVDVVFHAAALKHVPLCEYNPMDAVKTNVLGTQNLIEACLEQEVGKMVFISTDKAVEPINTMGASKLLAEKLVINATFYKGMRPTAFSIVRFGNVMGSRGSVIPVWIEQARNGGPITLTDPQMTRFMMSTQEAVQLIFKAAEMARGGEIFTFRMPAVRMRDMAEVIRSEVAQELGVKPSAIKVVSVGVRPGEKLHEALMNGEEASRALKCGQLYIIPLPRPDIPGLEPTSYGLKLRKMSEPYRSDTVRAMSRKEIARVLRKNGMLG
jgi:UDP-N-acetylglucosamine 4,6-dehydratase